MKMVVWLSVASLLLTMELHSLQVEPTLHTSESYDFRLVKPRSRERTSHSCKGILEMRHQGEWRKVDHWSKGMNLMALSVVCRQLDCGTVLEEILRVEWGVVERAWYIESPCVGNDSLLRDCGTTESRHSRNTIRVTCSESVRLVNGTGLCSGRVEVKSDQSWVSVCEGDFDQQDAEVVCRELGCGAPSVLQGALYREANAPMCTREFQCEGSESALLDCRTSNSTRNTCSPDKTVGLTCSEPDDIRLVGGTSRCTGFVEIKYRGKWQGMIHSYLHWTDNRKQEAASVMCRQLGCGVAVNRKDWRERTTLEHLPRKDKWLIMNSCVGSESSLRECATFLDGGSSSKLELTCSDFLLKPNITLFPSVNGVSKDKQQGLQVLEGSNFTIRCFAQPQHPKGFFYVVHKTHETEMEQANDPVYSVDFPFTLADHTHQGEYECIYHVVIGEQRLYSHSEVLSLTVTEPEYDFRLVKPRSGERTSHSCKGILEMRHQGDWRKVDHWSKGMNLMALSVLCRQLDCGNALAERLWVEWGVVEHAWYIESPCVGNYSLLRDCGTTKSRDSRNTIHVTCSESVRLVNGTGLCSGRVEVKSDQLWVSVCEGDFDQQDAEVVCMELGCGSPSVLQGALYGEVNALMCTKEFQCEGSESALLDCRTSDSTRNTCSPDKPVGLTCSEPDDIRLVGGTSRCTGFVEIKYEGAWHGMIHSYHWTDNRKPEAASVMCRQLGCGFAVYRKDLRWGLEHLPREDKWLIMNSCVGFESSLRECATYLSGSSTSKLELTCSDFLLKPNITLLFPSVNGVSKGEQQGLQLLEGSNFTIRCSAQPQYPKGFFYVVHATHKTELQPADDPLYSVDFPFTLADHTHQGEYQCIYHVVIGEHRLSSHSEVLSLTVTEPESVRLVNGTGFCSGRVEVVNTDQSWVSVCEGDFDQQDAEVVCRELGCGAPSVLQGALYGEVNAPMWTKELQCEGSESVLLDCRTSNSTRNTCSADKTVGLTCSEPDDIRLVGGTSRCTGFVEIKKRGEWRGMIHDPHVYDNKKLAASVVCRQLGCGFAVSHEKHISPTREPKWFIVNSCVGSESSLRGCARYLSGCSSERVKVTCSGFLLKPHITLLNPFVNGGRSLWALPVLEGSNFTIRCSTQTQYGKGYFSLVHATHETGLEPADDPLFSVDFQFLADHTHQGDYMCMHHVVYNGEQNTLYSPSGILTLIVIEQ